MDKRSSEKIYLCSVYMDITAGDKDYFKKEFLKIKNEISFINNKFDNPECILLGDFNERIGNYFNNQDDYLRFGKGKPNDKGLMLIKIINDMGLFVHNLFEPDEYTHKGNIKYDCSVIDYILSSNSNTNKCSFYISPGKLSDHNMLLLDIDLSFFSKPMPIKTIIERFELKKLREDSFLQEDFAKLFKENLLKTEFFKCRHYKSTEYRSRILQRVLLETAEFLLKKCVIKPGRSLKC